jgi:predicted transcriptional regulator
MRAPLVADLMHTSVVSLTSPMPLLDAAHTLLRAGHSGAPVVDADQRVIGVLSEADVLDVLASAAFYGSSDATVAERMSDVADTVRADDDLFALVDRFKAHPVRRLPVVDVEGRLVGIIGRHDVLEALARLVEEAHPLLRHASYAALRQRFAVEPAS